MNSLKDLWNSIEETTRKGICFSLAIIFVFASGNFVGSITKINTNGAVFRKSFTSGQVQDQLTEGAGSAAGG